MSLFQVMISVFLISCSTEQNNNSSVIVDAFPNLNFEQPVDIQSPKDGTNRLFVLSQPGIVFVFDNDPKSKTKKVFLDISKKILYGGEQGLLGLAFHPDFKSNGFFFLDYTIDNPRRTVVSRFKVSAKDPDKADPQSEVILLEIEQPYSNHNGGQISFGPDGYLYFSMGDGGSGGDPKNNGQNLKSLLGKILRIDVDNKSNGKHYSIPNDNPFQENKNGYKQEIFAFGLRNVWRFSFDKEGNLWAADVGQNKWEEINLIDKGMNYGWRLMKGNHCFNPEDDCYNTSLALPIWEYGHNDMGGYSITGGFVYNGKSAPGLSNKYVYADYVNGKIWTLELVNGKVNNRLLVDTEYLISTFGTDENDELYFADHNKGKLYKFAVK